MVNNAEYKPVATAPTPPHPGTHVEPVQESASLFDRGWRRALFLAASATSVVFVLNLTVSIWALATHDIAYGSAELYHGSCELTKNLNIGVHAIINAFSSVILSGSNYAMQCLSSPTRSEVDDAHAGGMWLDIGVPSVRNLKRIAKKRMWLWIVLGLSSVPLHLFYNSIVFTTISANEYSVYIVNEPWLSSDDLVPYDSVQSDVETGVWDAYQAGMLELLSPPECIDAYARSFVSARSHLIVVSSPPNGTAEDAEIFDVGSGGGIHITGAMAATNLDPYPWICGYDYSSDEFCKVDRLGIRQDPSTWRLAGRSVDYCLSMPTEEHCKLRLNATIAMLVTALNLLKAVLIFYVCFRLNDQPLLNIGDAISSFMKRPDIGTEGSCLLTREDAARNANNKYQQAWGSRVFRRRRRHWFAAVSRRRLVMVLFASSIGIGVCAAFLVYGVLKMPGASASDVWSLGFGEATQHTLITFQGIRRRMIRTQGTLSNVLIANSGQTVLSFLYFGCNGILTSMLLSHEWSSYAIERKALRVQTLPQGQQRTSYFLQLPWRYGVPIILSSTLLHWLASQSIFLVTVEQWRNSYETGEWAHDDFWDFATCAYSPLALFIFTLTAVILLLVLISLGFRKFRSGMPVAGSCSLAISAACHPLPEEDAETAVRSRLQWGVIGQIPELSGTMVYRCGFSSREVAYPEDGTMCG